MNKVTKFDYFILLLLIAMLCTPLICFADAATYYGGSGTSTGGGGAGGSNHFAGYKGYRFTLVDNKGQKYVGTRSVDIVYSSTSENTVENTVQVISEGSQNSLIYSNYKYRFGENNPASYIKLGSNIISIGRNSSTFDVEQHNLFINNYITNYKNTTNFCLNSTSCDKKIDFISLILYYMKYFEVVNDTPNELDVVLAKHPDLINYYFAVELLVAGTDGGKYGTSTEMLQYMYEFGGSSGYAQTFRDNIAVEKLTFACGLYTTKAFKEKYPQFDAFGSDSSSDAYFSSYEDCVRKSLVGEGKSYLWTGNSCVLKNGWPYGVPNLFCEANNYGGGSQIDNLRNFNDTKGHFASGVAMISLSPEDGSLSSSLTSKLKMCTDNSVSFNITALNTAVRDNDLFNVNLGVDNNQAIYCYDNVSFDYSKLVDENVGIAGVKLFNTKLQDVPSITANIKRTCYFNSDISSFNIKKEIIEDYNKSIIVNAYGGNIEFKPDVDNIVFTNGMYVIQYKVSNPIVFRSSHGYNTVQTGYIDFSNYTSLLGASSNFIKKIVNDDYKECNLDVFRRNDLTYCFTEKNKDNKDINYGLKLTDNSSEGKCVFNYTVKKDNSGIPSDTKFKFRVISLENPFPARDGTSRLPGLNWLNDHENNVFPYIINNRGVRYITQSNDVSPEEIYNKTSPMYTITLTPSKMLEIRNYNKTYAYDSMYSSISADKTSSGAYKLECNYHDLGSGKIGNGRECYSTFLRQYFNNDEISGVCYLSSTELNSYEQGDDTLSESISEVISKGTGYEKKYDLNMNNRIDNEDVFLSLKENNAKNIKYYTCAGKSFLSGGPIEGGN